MVVPVLMTSCQVSEKWKTGPVIAQTIMTKNASMKAKGEPVAFVTVVENLSNFAVKEVEVFFI